MAVRVLPERFTNNAARERFQRKARAASALSHPNICAIYDVGESNGNPFLVMELLEAANCRAGETLAREKVEVEDKEHVLKAVATAATVCARSSRS